MMIQMMDTSHHTSRTEQQNMDKPVPIATLSLYYTADVSINLI